MEGERGKRGRETYSPNNLRVRILERFELYSIIESEAVDGASV
jgi:hypothetical protein